MNVSLNRTAARTATAGIAAATLLALAAPAAYAHVTVNPDTTAAGAYALLTVGVPHGCEESSTTRVSIQIPESIPRVTPSINPNWDVEKVMTTLETPLDDGHGGQITERVSEVVYTAKVPLPAELRDSFVLSAKLPDAAGETLYFPTVQTCEVGETPWIEIAAEGQDADALEKPAPAIELTAATGGHGTSTAAVENTAAASDSGAPAAVSWIALVLGAVGLGLGGLAFTRSRSNG
jgi:uncharacterized protein YcnI